MPAPNKRLTAFVVAMAVLIATPLAVVASDAFTDVPDSNVHHADITWLADAGVTLGCNPPANTNFCPGEPVLRQQMASFLRRLAENQVVDAGTLGGEEPSAYETRVAAAYCDINEAGTATSCTASSDGSLPNETTVELLSVELSAPASGTVQINASRVGTVTTWATVDDACAPYVTPFLAIFSQVANGILFGGLDAFAASGTAAVNVGPGDHEVRLCVVYEGTDGGGNVLLGNLTAQWSQGGSVELAGSASGGSSSLLGSTLLGD